MATHEKILKVVPGHSNLVTMYVCMHVRMCVCMYVRPVCVLIRSCNNNPIKTKSMIAYMHLLQSGEDYVLCFGGQLSQRTQRVVWQYARAYGHSPMPCSILSRFAG